MFYRPVEILNSFGTRIIRATHKTVKKTICSLFYYVILYPMLLVLDFVLKLFGSKGMFHYLSSGDCFKFNVMSDLNHIKNGFVKAGNTFGNQFGRFDKFKFKI